jgi:DNA-binding beta-propeller fold protein YncE
LSVSLKTVKEESPVSDLPSEIPTCRETGKAVTTKSIIMKAIPRCLGVIPAIMLSCLTSQVWALELVHYIEAGDYAEVIENAAGLKITDDGVILISSQEKGTLLKITNGKIVASTLTPSIFKDSDLGGIEVLGDGNLVVANEDSGQIAILDSELSRIVRFSQSGSNPGELNDPGPVATSINNRIYVGDVGNRRISVFNHQGLYLYEFGKHGAGDDLGKFTHVSIDAEENVYVLEGSERLSIFDLQGKLISRIKSSDLKDLFGAVPEFSAMTTDLNGTLYLGDRVTNRISIYDWRKREVISVFGVFGKARSQYLDITYLSVNALGQLAVLDRKNQKEIGRASCRERV